MTVTGDVIPLQVGDEPFLVASTIERCPKLMMLRELMKNALEAAALADEGRRLIEITSQCVAATPKLVIWNTGPGMDAKELYEMCDLAVSFRKEKSLDGNFGWGAKVASLPSNQLGMRYRSCKHGRVHEVILCKRGGVYGRLRRYNSDDGTYDEVLDVTDIVFAEGRTSDEDWTEVMLLGNEDQQDTVRDPFNGDPKLDVQWLATYLYHRFYRLPHGVKVLLLPGTHKLDGTRQFEPIPGRRKFFEKFETVETANGTKIHYLYDAPYDKARAHNRSVSGAIASAVSTCATIYKDEMYDVRKGRTWTLDAPIFGIPFGGKHISIHIELPDGASVRPEGYRQFLRYLEGEQAQVNAADFAELVREHRPAWLIELIRSLAPESMSNDEVRDELQRLLNDLRVHRSSPRVSINGTRHVTPGEGIAVGPVSSAGSNPASGELGRSRHTNLSIVPTGAKRASIWRNMERAPEIIPLRTDEEIEEKEIKGRAARYYEDPGQLFVNMQYPPINEMRELLEKEYAGTPEVEEMRAMALSLAERTMILRVGRAVVYALAKQLNKEWDHNAVLTALSPESLSLAADDFLDALQSARRKIGKRFRVSREEVAHDQAEAVATLQ